MKILQIAYSRDLAGGERVLLDISRGILESGHSVHAAIPGEGALSQALDQMNIPWTVCHLSKTYDLRGAMELAAIVKKESIDLVHSHGMMVNLLARWACLAARATSLLSGRRRLLPLVNTVHIARRLWLQRPSLSENLRNLYYRLYDRFSAPLASRIVAVSRAVVLDLRRQGVRGPRVMAIPNGIDLDRYGKGRRSSELRLRCGASEENFLIGMVGRLAPQKSLDIFLQAAAQAIKVNPGLRFAVAGDGPLRQELEALRDSLGLEKHFVFLGSLDNVEDFLASMDLFTLTSSWEGLPLSVLEAMAAGRAVAATAADGTVEALVHGQTGLLVRRGDSTGLASAYLELAGNPQQVASMEAAGLERVRKEFTLSRVRHQYLELYHQLLGQSFEIPSPGERR